MAAHPPGPLPPDDGSGVYRKSSSPSSIHRRRARPADDLPEEPVELVELIDDESMPIGDLPPASALRTDADLVIDEVLFADEPHTEPLRAGELSEQPTDPEPPVPPGGRGQAGDEESVVLSGRGVAPSHPGSGWYDPPAPPSTGKFEDAAQLFADLRGDAPESDTTWEADRQVTGRVSESDLFRAFDEAEAAGTEVGRPHLSPTAPPDNSDVFAVIPAGSGSLAGASGVNPTDPPSSTTNADVELDPVSSIFAKGDQPSHIPADDLPLLDDVPLAEPAAGGSSIFDRAVGRLPPEPSDPTVVEDAEVIGFDLPEPRGDSGSMSQVSGRIDLNTPFDDPVPSGRLPAVEEDTAPRPSAAAETTKPARAVRPAADLEDEPKKAKVKSGAAKVAARTAAVRDDEDEEAAGAGRSAGWGKFVGGAAFGLLAGGIAFVALYLTGVFPNQRKDTTSAAVAPARSGFTDPEVQTKLKELEDAKAEGAKAVKERDDLTAQLLTEKAATDSARIDAAKAADTLKRNQTELTKVTGEGEKTRADLIAAKKEAETATAAATTAVTTAAKTVDTLKTELDNSKKKATDLEKAAAEAETKVTDAAAKQKTAEDKLAGLVKEFKDAKILADGDDLSKLPAAVKRLAATATSTDSKKAADALVAAQKELDAAKATAKKYEGDLAAAVKARADAEAQVSAVKTEADKRVADAQKGVDDKVKAAVTAATQESKKQLDTATAAAKKAAEDLANAKATAKAEVEADAKKAIDAATAKASAAEAARFEAQKAYEQKLSDQAAQFAARIADAKSGVAVPVTSVETAALEKAAKGYADGMALFLAGRYAEAEPPFQVAATNGADARHWYFLGLTQYQLGRRTDAAAAFKKGADLEARGKPGAKAVGESLERVQSYLRRVLAEYRP